MIYKIAHHRYIFMPLILFFFHVPGALCQHFDTSSYGVPYIKQFNDYQHTVRSDSFKRMVELRSMVPGIKYDLRYAGSNNFMKRRMYPARTKVSFLRLPAARALADIQKELKNKGLGLKVFDAYRPYSVTVAFWELVRDDRYVANPAKASAHNRGLAVDLTLIDLRTGRELDMGTGFDNFTDTAHHEFAALPAAVLKNRQLLKEVMERNGFTPIRSEWWHYYWDNDRGYEVLDLEFDKLRRAWSDPGKLR